MLRFIPDNEGFRSDLVAHTDETLRVGIIDADLLDHGTRHPNLTLLKVSALVGVDVSGHDYKAQWDELQRLTAI